MSPPALLLAFDGSPGAVAAVRAAASLFPGADAVVATVQREVARSRGRRRRARWRGSRFPTP